MGLKCLVGRAKCGRSLGTPDLQSENFVWGRQPISPCQGSSDYRASTTDSATASSRTCLSYLADQKDTRLLFLL